MQKLIQGLAVFVILILLWQAAIAIWQVPSYLLPRPWQVLQTLYSQKNYLMGQLLVTFLESFFGLLMAIAWGVVVGVILLRYALGRWFLLPIIVLSQALPTLAVAPLFVLWLGFSQSAILALVVFSLFFPIAFALYDGVRQMPGTWRDQCVLLQATPWRRLWYVELPAAMPRLSSAIKLVTVWAPMAAVAGEWVGSDAGLGFVMVSANSQMNTELVFAAIVLCVILALVLYFSINYLLRRVIWW